MRDSKATLMETDVEKIEEHGIQKQPLHISDICCIVFFHLCFGVLCGVMLIGLYYGLTSIRTEKPMGWDPRVDQAPILRFGYDGTFRISVFEDLHLGEGEANPPEWGWGPASDIKTIGVMNKILDTERQELVILNGDLITGEDTHLHNATKYLDMIVEPLVKRGLPWASTYGNHDQDVNLSPRALLRTEQKYPEYSLTRSMVSHRAAGVTNYYVPVYSYNRTGGPVVLLWFFDSKGGRNYVDGTDIRGSVHPSVANWLQRTSASLNRQYNRTIPSLGFVHIPVYAMNAFQRDRWDSNRSPGINDDDPLSPQGEGPDGAYTGEDIPFMQALLQTDGLKAVFSGHDHGNDWCQKWDRKYSHMNLTGNSELFFCFGRHTGYGGYGQWMRGSRQIKISLDEKTQDVGIETWVRLEDGSMSGKVKLNATFGEDSYPRVQRKLSW